MLCASYRTTAFRFDLTGQKFELGFKVTAFELTGLVIDGFGVGFDVRCDPIQIFCLVAICINATKHVHAMLRHLWSPYKILQWGDPHESGEFAPIGDVRVDDWGERVVLTSEGEFLSLTFI